MYDSLYGAEEGRKLNDVVVERPVQWVMYRLEVGKKRNGSMKTQRLSMRVTQSKQWIWERGGEPGAQHIIYFSGKKTAE